MPIVFFCIFCIMYLYRKVNNCMECNCMFVVQVVAAKIVEGKTKDGRPFHFCQTWIPADDGSLVFFNANEDLFPGDKIKVGINSYGSSIRLQYLGKA